MRTGLSQAGTGANDNKAKVPDDPYTKDVCIRFINDGYRRFLNHDPEWSFLRERVVITFDVNGTGTDNVDGKAWRYRIPRPFSGPPTSPWVYTDTASPYTHLIERNEQFIMRMHQRGVNAAPARYVAYREIPQRDAPDGERAGWEMIVWPTPTSAYTVQAVFKLRKHELHDLAEAHICGGDHDNSILNAAVYEWTLHDASRRDRIATLKTEMEQHFADSVELDKAKRVKNHGQWHDTSIRPDLSMDAEPVDATTRATFTYDVATLT